MIFAHRHADPGSDPCHRADCRNQAEANDRAGNPPAVRPKNMFTSDQRYFESTFQILDRCRRKKDGIEQNVNHDHETGSDKQ